jgi:hypothetical protein
LAEALARGLVLRAGRSFDGAGSLNALGRHGLILEEAFHARQFALRLIEFHPALAGRRLERCKIGFSAKAGRQIDKNIALLYRLTELRELACRLHLPCRRGS